MPAKKVKKLPPRARSWKDIDQSVKARSMSSTAWKRLVFGRARTATLAAAGVVLAISAYHLTKFAKEAPTLLSQTGESLTIDLIDAQSDGPLTKQWILDYLDLAEGESDLLAIDLDGLKAKLEKLPQVLRAELARRFPDTLLISIEERDPVAKIIAADVQRGRICLLVDETGFAFEGNLYARKQVLALPTLDGVRLKRLGPRSYEPIRGMGEVAELLREASVIAPHLYANWRIVSLADLPSIKVAARNVQEIYFKPADFRGQLARLDYILDYQRSHLVEKSERIDLRHERQVPVKGVVIAR